MSNGKQVTYTKWFYAFEGRGPTVYGNGIYNIKEKFNDSSLEFLLNKIKQEAKCADAHITYLIKV